MSYSTIKVSEIVSRSVAHEWSIPEFQRGFVWKSTQVRDLAESLMLGYPVGNILVWNSASSEAVSPRSAHDAETPSKWLVDGQQRTTALCILSGRKPYWWSSASAWDELIKRYDIRFDIEAVGPPYFVVANAAIRRTSAPRYVRVADLVQLNLERDADQAALASKAEHIKKSGLCAGFDAFSIMQRLTRVQRIRDRDLVAMTVDHELEEVVEIFARLNSRGTRVKESDIYLGIVAARTPGWVREEFLPFIEKLEGRGFSVTPNLLFQSLTGVGVRRVRFKQVDDAFWNADRIQPAWKAMKEGWQRVLTWLRDYGLLSNAVMPAAAGLVTAVALFERFPDTPKGIAFEWFLQSLRYGRYSSSGSSSLEEDLREIEQAETGLQALTALRRRIRAIEPFSAEEFLRDYSDNLFGRLMLYLLVFDRKAEDWSQGGERLAFQGGELTSGFSPQFHHIFPRGFLAEKVPAFEIEALANIAIIGQGVNIKISDSDPLAYFDRYGISEAKRQAQLIEGQVSSMTPENFTPWLEERAEALADAANAFMQTLGAATSEGDAAL